MAREIEVILLGNKDETDSFQDASEHTPQTASSEQYDEDKGSSDVVENATTDDEKPKEKEVDEDQGVEPGMKMSTQELYRNERYDQWAALEGPLPEDDYDKYKKYALVVRRERDPNEGGVLLHSISIQSPHIRDFLSKVFAGYRGVYTNLKKLVLRPPYHEFFYRWEKFNQVLAETTDEVALKHINLLKDVIEPQTRPHLEAQEDMIKVGVISFEYLWALFPQDTEVYAETDSGPRLFLARRCWYRKGYNSLSFIVDCEYIDNDGTMIGWATEKLEIDAFSGLRDIKDINPIPTSFKSNMDDIRQKLISRGKAFQSLTGLHYRGYTGLYLPQSQNVWVKPRRRYVEKGRIVIDAKLYHEQDPDKKPTLRGLESQIEEKVKVDGDYNYYDNTYDEHDAHTGNELAASAGRTTLNEDEYCYCSPLVTGYNLTSKQWATFEAINATEVPWSHNAFEKLVLPFDYKELILAFADSQISHKDKFDDIIAGKGQGIIMLLSGEPGVGKTLTAEAVAEEMKRPLYSMSAGELGSNASEVEMNLEKVLEISAKWDAVLLLDECDVFLEQRTLTDIDRNKLVSVFLRLLEYFKGVMFLTTNRVSAFDLAFQSRIHLTLNYPPLDQASRRMIWTTFVHPEHERVGGAALTAAPKSTITEAELDELAALKLNGREIKNIIKTARLLATRKSIGLNMAHVKTVLRIKQDTVSNSVIAED